MDSRQMEHKVNLACVRKPGIRQLYLCRCIMLSKLSCFFFFSHPLPVAQALLRSGQRHKAQEVSQGALQELGKLKIRETRGARELEMIRK